MQPVNRSIGTPNIGTESKVQAHPDHNGATRRRINASVVSAIVADHYLMILGLALLCAAATVAWVMHNPRKFTASVTVAPVGNARQLNIPSSIAGSLLGSMNSGIQATPVFVARLARLHGVLDEVAREKVPGRNQIVIEGVMRQPKAEIPPYKYALELDKQLQTTIDRESGTVTFSVALADSALARTIASSLIESVSRAYTRSMKSQAGALVEAQAARVDSAAKRVRQAGSALVQFDAANRVVPNTSALWVEQQRLQASVTIAQDIYTQAVTELENARGRAIEDAPALVVLDPVPLALPPRGRGTVLIGFAAFVLSALVVAAFVLVREAATNVYATGDRDIVRLVSSLEQLPLVGKRAVRWFVRA
jgi:uncharacterized protein involved in exopolysaccharide biosynthesis